MNLTEAARDLLLDYGWVVFRVNQGRSDNGKLSWVNWYLPADRKRRSRGITDLFAIRKRQIIFVECKSPDDRISPEQNEFMSVIQAHGFTAVTVYNVSQLKVILDALDTRFSMVRV